MPLCGWFCSFRIRPWPLSGALGNEGSLSPCRKTSRSGYWLRIAPEGERLLGDLRLQRPFQEFNELKHKIMLCEGLHLLCLHRDNPLLTGKVAAVGDVNATNLQVLNEKMLDRV